MVQASEVGGVDVGDYMIFGSPNNRHVIRKEEFPHVRKRMPALNQYHAPTFLDNYERTRVRA